MIWTKSLFFNLFACFTDRSSKNNKEIHILLKRNITIIELENSSKTFFNIITQRAIPSQGDLLPLTLTHSHTQYDFYPL